MIQDPQDAESAFEDGLPIYSTKSILSAPVQIGTPNAEHASVIVESIRESVQLALQKRVRAVVTNPISKAVLYESGFRHPGHTEFIAALCDEHTDHIHHPVMMLVGGGLKVALATIHIPLKDVPSAISTEQLTKTAHNVDKALRQDFGIVAPRIAFSGLNPHAGESGTIGQEEVDLINPTAADLRSSGINVSDARPGDTVFNEALDGAFDAVIAMSHDQGLIPVKVLDFWGGVNATLGLPIIRTSPDHGTAYDAAKSGEARPDSLIAALNLAAAMANHRIADDHV